jgi:hypothetical protein
LILVPLALSSNVLKRTTRRRVVIVSAVVVVARRQRHVNRSKLRSKAEEETFDEGQILTDCLSSVVLEIDNELIRLWKTTQNSFNFIPFASKSGAWGFHATIEATRYSSRNLADSEYRFDDLARMSLMSATRIQDRHRRCENIIIFNVAEEHKLTVHVVLSLV